MRKLIVLSIVAVSFLAISSPANGAVRFGVGLGYGRSAFRSGPMWFGPAYWNPPMYYVLPARSSNTGQLRVDTNAREASVYIDGAFAGTVAKMKTLSLRSGNYDVEVRSTNGGVFDEKVFVPVGRKIVIEPVFTAASK